LFTFGFGLSYTSFVVDDLTVSAPSSSEGLVTARFTVSNVGTYDGTDVIPVLVHQAAASLVLPPHRLVGFARVQLAAGESRDVTVQFPTSRLAITPGDVDSSAAPAVAPGQYTVEVPTAVAPDDLFPSATPPLLGDFSLN
jgi:beta-glucosidase